MRNDVKVIGSDNIITYVERSTTCHNLSWAAVLATRFNLVRILADKVPLLIRDLPQSQ